MWARVSEIILGIWLFVSHFLFMTSIMDIVAAVLILAFSGLSFISNLNKMHLLQVIPVGYLLYAGYSAPCISASVQNDILVALFLLLFCIIPSQATKPPRAWRRQIRSTHK